MAEVLLGVGAFFCSFCGMAWLALAKLPHWQQARGERPLAPRTVVCLQALGAAALVASLLLGLWVDHASMATLVWVMTLSAAALLVALTLAWRPRCLAWLVAWLG